jgi:heme A synthase
VITGTWIVYPWYREALAVQGDNDYAGCAGAVLPTGTCSPRDFLKSNVSGDTELWHNFGMEWKEHIAWISPILATVVAFIVLYYGASLIRNDRLRKTVMVLFVLAFAMAAVAGALGAFITKAEPL